jgi:hypothetical protein
MTSRELFVLIEQLPEESATRRALAEDEWTEDRHLLAAIANAVTFFRADWANAHGGSMRPNPIESPAMLREREREREANLKAQQSLHDLIHGRIKVAAATRVQPRAPEIEVH